MDNTKSASEARRDFAGLVNRVTYGGERVVLTKNNKRAAAIVSAEDLDLLESLEDAIDVREARKILQRMRTTGEKPIPWSQMKKELGDVRGKGVLHKSP